MRRIFAILALLCCLLSCGVAAVAAPVEEDTQQTEESAIQEETAQPEQEAPAEEEPVQTQEPQEVTTIDLSAIEGETAIRTMEVTAAVDEAGRAGVSVLIEMNIVGTVDELRFSFPEGAKNTRIIGYAGRAKRENGIKYLTIKQRGGFARNVKLEMTYTMEGLVSLGEDSQILTLPLLSLQDYRVGSLTFAVAMPEMVQTRPRFQSGYYNELVEDVMTVRTEDVWVVGVMKEIMRDNDTLSMTLVVPDGYFVGRHGQSKLPVVLTVLTLVLLAAALLYWLILLRSPMLKVRSRSLPPDGVNPSDLPYLLCGGDVDFNLLISHWAALGYLSIHVSKSGHVLLQRRMDMGNERRRQEQKLFALLFAEEDVCDGASVRYKRVGEKAGQVIRKYWNKRLFEKDSGSPTLANGLCWLACAFATMVAMDAVAPGAGHGFFLVLALIAGAAMGIMINRAPGAYYLSSWLYVGIGVACALLMLIVGGIGGATLTVLPAVVVTAFLGWQTCHGGKRRPYGDEVIAQSMGFRRFMLHASEHHVMQMLVRDPQYFYRLLPYAEAMGLGKRFVSLFHDCRLEACPWYSVSKGKPTTAESFYVRYKDTLDLLNLSLKK